MSDLAECLRALVWGILRIGKEAYRGFFSDNTLVALTIMIAESKPEEKEAMVALIMSFLTGK